MVENPQVKDIVYKVVNDWINNQFEVASFKVLSVNKKNILRVYRIDKDMGGKFNQTFRRAEVYSTREKAINEKKLSIEKDINRLKIDLEKIVYLRGRGRTFT